MTKKKEKIKPDKVELSSNDLMNNFSIMHERECLDVLNECKDILKAKAKDYGNNNFIDSAKIASIMCGKDISPQDIANCFACMKLVRIANLDSIGTAPVHESVSDSVRDLINYIIISRRERSREEEA